MKKISLLILISLFSISLAFSQNARTISAGNITSNTTWYSDTIYTLDGYVYVKNNATLTIQAGTIIKGGLSARKSTLIITRNGMINAQGTENSPIVFTSSSNVGSRAPGDWGGIVILGKAIINRPTDCSTCPGATVAAGETGIQNAIEGDLDNTGGDGLYGGTDNNHNAGILRYVRLEYGGVVITPGNEINGLTMGGLGKATQIDHIQVTQANDDGFEWFGGNVDGKYLVSNRNIDDDFDTDFGFTGKIQFGICMRDSNWYDIGSGPTTNGFESDNDGSGTEAQPFTDPTFSNMTIIGPLANGTVLSTSTSFQNGLRLRRNSSTSVFNSVVMGWADGLFIDGARSGNKHQNDTLLFKNNILAGNLRAVNNSSLPNAGSARTKIYSQANDSILSASGVLTAPFNYTNPNYMPATGSPALSGASFTGAKISDAFFTPTSYRGAVGGSNDWTKCWCNFNPQNSAYTTAPVNNMPITYDAGKDSTICSSKSLVIGQSLTGPYKYSWTPSTGLSSATAARPTASPSVTTKYYGTIMDSVSGCMMMDSITITVTPTPTANFTFAAGSGGTINFTNSSTNATTYSWNFGNGQTSTTASPSNTYTANGTYNVSLTAISGTCTNSINKLVTVTGVNSPFKAVTGDITANTIWFRDTIYTMNGYVYVKNGATLTIQSGTIIKGGANKGTLIITRNGNINANGTRNQPIVFTSDKAIGSRAPGDWGGIVILGKAIINRPTDCSTCPGATVAAGETGIQNAIEGDLDNTGGDGLYGGTDDNHNSGIIRYVRIEFGGVVITPGNEINGLTMGGVGKSTQIDHVQVTQSNDDGFEWFGGNVNGKFLISNRNVDDDFDTDFGFTGKVQFGICMRDSNWYDIGSGPTTNGFESDNDGTGTEAKPFTEPTFSNMTIIGPLANGTALSTATSFQNGARIRKNSSMSLFNSIIMGWPDGVFIDGARSGNKHQNDTLLFKNNIIAGNLRAVNNSSLPSASAARTKIMGNANDTMTSAMGVLVNPFNYNSPVFAPAPGSAALGNASFTGNKINDAYFIQTPFRGAVGPNPDSNWTDCWCKFNPQQENYTSAPINYLSPSADFNAGTPSGRTVNFSNNSSNATMYLWNFGVDGLDTDTSTLLNPSFNFPKNGTYTVTLLTRSACGLSSTSRTVVVNDTSLKPVANYTYVQNSTSGSLQFTFTNTTDEKGFATSYKWYFGDTQTDTAKNPVHTYSARGIYNVKLVAMGLNGTDSITKSIVAIATSAKEEASVIDNITVYPNPATSTLNVDFDLTSQSSLLISMYDITGKLLLNVTNSELLQAGNYTLPVNISSLNQGLYLMRIETLRGSKTVRIVVTK